MIEKLNLAHSFPFKFLSEIKAVLLILAFLYAKP